MTNRQLEEILQRLGLKISGAKNARIERIVTHFEHTAPTITSRTSSGDEAVRAQPIQHQSLNPEVIANQAAFRERASNPQASLQPWLDELLNARGLVRCYATEDSNPTKQLKNKLSLAAAAQDGLLVLLLADADAFLKAREALVERWMTNAEWSKSVACIALAYPLGEPSVPLIIERVQNPWSTGLRSKLFPGADVVSVAPEITVPSRSTCTQCSAELPKGARFCPNCGSPVELRDGDGL